jgi:hypothetical protein
MRSICNAVIICFLCFCFSTTLSAQENCRWSGTAPICGGGCNDDETELTRMISIPGHWVPPFVSVNPHFGENCVTGSKSLCCKRYRGAACRWDGTAPFCDGECRAGESPASPPPGSSSGQQCVTGSKVYCCGSAVAAVAHRLSLTSTIRSKSGKCLDVAGGQEHTNGGKVQLWDCWNGPMQQWWFDGVNIKTRDRKCLDVKGDEQNLNGGKVQIWDCWGGDMQKWRIEGEKIISHSGKCLDVKGDEQNINGARIQIWDCWGGDMQKWRSP